ncbi:MAG: bacteriohemerythrin [Jhaorihella sp.]
MARIEWKPEFSVGDPAVDHEHRELIDLVNVTAGAVLEGGNADEVARDFGELYRAISAHFALEERQMREAGYDRLTQHKGDHERLLDVLRDLMDDPQQAGAEPAENLARALEDWFVGHFRDHDSRLHRVLGPHPHS